MSLAVAPEGLTDEENALLESMHPNTWPFVRIHQVFRGLGEEPTAETLPEIRARIQEHRMQLRRAQATHLAQLVKGPA